MKAGIYLIVNAINGKEYVGSSKNPDRRKYSHFYELKRDRHPNLYLQNSYNKYGPQSLAFIVIEYCDVDRLQSREDWWITLLGTMHPSGFNCLSADRKIITDETKAKLSEVGKVIWSDSSYREKMLAIRKANPTFPRGSHLTEEHKASLSAAHLGQKAWNKGIPVTEEVRSRLRVARLGSKLSEEHKARISAANKGKQLTPMTDEIKAKISAANKGKPGPNKGRVFSTETRAKMSASAKARYQRNL